MYWTSGLESIQPTLIEQSSFAVLKSAIEEWLRYPVCVCSIDAEWPPARSSSLPNTATVLQLAVWSPAIDPEFSRVQSFVLDLISLDMEELSPLLKRLFRADSFLKVGYGFSSDMRALSQALGRYGDSTMSTIRSVVDIRALHRMLSRQQVSSSTPRYGGGLDQVGLSDLVGTLLGAPLDKSQQCSDWGNRPLTEDQIEYASTDACCLLALLNEFARRCVGESGVAAVEGMNKVLELWGEVWHWTGHRVEKKEKAKDVDEPVNVKGQKNLKKPLMKGGLPPFRAVPTRIPWTCPGNSKFLVDVMLYGLARQLRLWGIDTEAIDTVPKGNRHIVHRQLVQRAAEEGRVILTCDVVFLTRGLSDHAYYVKTYNGNARQQLLDVVEYFKLKSVITKESLLSRCARCNGEFGDSPVPGSSLKDRCSVPLEVRNRAELEFWECQRCGTVYWQGNMYARAMERLTKELGVLKIM